MAVSEAIGEWIVGGIHHVGSTAVPGLEAKPIIDILAGVRDLQDSRACFEPLAQLGYMYAPYLADEMHWFCKPDPSRRTHHLHSSRSAPSATSTSWHFATAFETTRRSQANTSP